MILKQITDLENILVKELKDENLNKKALNETWNVLHSPSNQGHEVTKEHLVNYYVSCIRFESLKD
jgi:hypothetical protein